MSERKAAYTAVNEERCEKCARVLAVARPDGGLLFEGAPVLVIAGTCKECGHPFTLPRQTGLEITHTGYARLSSAIRIIQGNEGYGTVSARFEGYRLVRVLVGDLTWNVR